MALVSWGTGRVDYSKDIESSVTQIITGHQGRDSGYGTYNYTPYWFVTIDWSEFFDGWLMIYDSFVTAKNRLLYFWELEYDANVLIKAYFGIYDANTGTATASQVQYCYKKIRFEFPKGFLITKEMQDNNQWPAVWFSPGGYIVRVSNSYLRDDAT